MKIFYTSVLFIISFFPAVLQAKQVSQETAQQVAESQALSQNQLRSGQPLVLSLVHTEITGNQATNSTLKSSGSASTNVVYYVFNVEGNGFVIVSGDDIAVPVLGYSDSGMYDPGNLSPNLVYYLNYLSGEINGAIANGLPQSEETKEQWDAYLTGNTSSLRASAANTPFLDVEGIKWDQTAPYNGNCPLVGDTLSTTGCVATATAQIMRYYKYPAYGSGTVNYYSHNNDSTVVIHIQKNLSQSNSSYDWNNMLPTYYKVNANTAQQNAVALLMYDCGITAQTGYDTPANGGSGATDWNAGNALINNFSYSKGSTYKERYFYSDADWDTMLKAEIDAGHPVLYGGNDPKNGGHAFVCDGYDNTGKFHFNWGWSGADNGYFATTALNPEPPYQFNQYQEMVAGISPNSGAAAGYEIILDAGSTNPLKLTSTNTQVTNNNKDYFNITAQYYFNNGFNTLNGYPGVALYNQSNQLVYVLATYNTKVQNLPIRDSAGNLSGSGYSWTNVTIPSSVSPGNYLIKPIVISTAKDTIPVHVPLGTTLPLTVVNGGTGLENINSALKVNVYESNGLIQMMSDALNPIKEIAVYDLQGSLVYKADSVNATSYTVNQKLPVGVYIVKVISENGADNVKLILH